MGSEIFLGHLHHVGTWYRLVVFHVSDKIFHANAKKNQETGSFVSSSRRVSQVFLV